MTLKKLGEIAEVFSGVRTSRYIDENGLKTKVFLGNPSNSLDWEYQKISPNINDKFFSQKDDLVIHLSNFFTVERLNDEGLLIPMQYAVIRINDEYESKYIYHILKSKYFMRKLERFQMGSVLKFIKIDDLKSIKLDMPDEKTQKKYAQLLELFDLKIKLKNQEIKLINDFKDVLIETGEKNG